MEDYYENQYNMVQDGLADIDAQKANVFGGPWNPTGNMNSGYLGSYGYTEKEDDNY